MITAGYSIFHKNQYKRGFCSLLFVFIFLFASSQPPFFRTYNYIENYSGEAIRQMIEYKIPASVILAQAILESRSGTSDLAKRSNNHFGIKCHNGWAGDTIIKDDDSTGECFRSYKSILDSYNDHSIFLSSRPRYAQLFTLAVDDYKGWCFGLKAAGYATAPAYAEELIKLIEEMKLYVYDGAEKLRSRHIIVNVEHKLKDISINLHLKSLKAYAETNLLFCDENDIVIQSLNLIYLSGKTEFILSLK